MQIRNTGTYELNVGKNRYSFQTVLVNVRDVGAAPVPNNFSGLEMLASNGSFVPFDLRAYTIREADAHYNRLGESAGIRAIEQLTPEDAYRIVQRMVKLTAGKDIDLKEMLKDRAYRELAQTIYVDLTSRRAREPIQLDGEVSTPAEPTVFTALTPAGRRMLKGGLN